MADPQPRGVFTIQEMPVDGSAGDRFEWVAATTPPSGSAGGARACPVQPWSIGGRQHTVRTDYPGAVRPSEQVMGPRRKPFTLSGRWDDRYNFGGYAKQEMARFEALCERGNPCRFQFLSVARDGIIVDWDLDYRREWDISYKFEVSVHDNPNRPADQARSIPDVESPSSTFDKVQTSVQLLLDTQSSAPAPHLIGTLGDDLAGDLSTLLDNHDALAGTLDNQDLAPTPSPVDAFTRVATQFRAVRAAAFDVSLRLAIVRADTDLAILTAMNVLNFEDWSRSMRYSARVAMLQAQAGDRAATERAQPDAKHLYRPFAGESLYSISRKFYGTPFAWRLIYERNSLTSFALTGRETLIIPERGGT